METTPKTHVLTPCRLAFRPQKKQIWRWRGSLHQHKKHKVGCPSKIWHSKCDIGSNHLSRKTFLRILVESQDWSRLYNSQGIFLVKGGSCRNHSIYCNPVTRQYKCVYKYTYIYRYYICMYWPTKNGLAKLPIWVRVLLYICNDINTLPTLPFPIAIFQVPKITSL